MGVTGLSKNRPVKIGILDIINVAPYKIGPVSSLDYVSGICLLVSDRYGYSGLRKRID